jgi:hypothetical protein
MDIDCEYDHIYPSSPVDHSSNHQEELVEAVRSVDLPRDVAVTGNRPTWFLDTL